MSSDYLLGHNDIIDEVVFDNPAKGLQYRFTVSEFRDAHYLSIREWILGWEGEWVPTKNGMTFPYSLHVVSGLFKAFCGVLSKAEVITTILEKLKSDPSNSVDERC